MNGKLFIAAGIFHPEAGGPATYLFELLPELVERGWEVRVVTYGEGGTAEYPYPLKRIPRRALPLRLAQYARAARPALRWADLAYVHSLGLPLAGGRAPRVVKIVGDQAWERAIRKGWIPATEDIDAFQRRRYTGMAGLQQAIRSRQARAMDGVIVPSQYLKNMVAGWGVPESRIHVVYNAMPPEQHPQAGTQTEARQALRLGDEPLLLTAARLNPWKGVDHLINALDAVPNVRLLVAGDGEQEPALRRLAAERSLSGRVTFLGRVGRRQLTLYMRAADYVALYSGYEGLSHTLLESLRAGTPVIASAKGGNPEVVQHGVNGLLAPYVDIEGLRAILAEAFLPGKRAALAANVSVGMERFDFGRMVTATDRLLRQYAGLSE